MKKLKSISLTVSQFIIGLIALFIFSGSYFDRLVSDLRFKVRGKQNSSGEIVIVAIDEESLQLGRWPWRRDILALLTERIFELGAKNIGFDIFFSEKYADQAEADALFAKVLAKQASRVTLAWFKDETGKIHRNIDLFSRATQSQGFANSSRDSDGMFRSVKYYMATDRKEPSLALAVVAQRLGVSAFSLVSVDDSPIRHLGPAGTFKTISAIDLLRVKSKETEKDLNLKDKTIFVGVTGLGVGDVQPTPLGEAVPGVEIQASIAEQLLTQQVPRISKVLNWALGVGLILILSFFSIRLSLLRFLFFGLSLLGVFFVLDFFVLFPRGWYLNSGNIYLASGVVLLLSVAKKYYEQNEQKRFIRNAFSRYLAPEVVQQLLTQPETLKLGGEKRILTILFCDLRNFTALSEKLEPNVLTQLLNETFTLLTEIVFKHKGTVDKYIGDALMAFFGAPIEQPDQAFRACEAAQEMVQSFQKKQGEFKAKYGVELSLGIGINTGPCLVGNIGSEQRFSYSVLGDAVNVAARVESCNKDYGTKILITDSVIASIEENKLTAPQHKFVDKPTLKGRSTPTSLFELLFS